MGRILLIYHQTQIDVLIWMVQLGRIDIITEVSLLASQFALPCEGHHEAVFHILGYLKGHHYTQMVFDPIYTTPNMSLFHQHYWCDFYGDVKEAIPPNAPVPRGKEVDLRIFVDSDHAEDKLTRRYISGYIIFLNNDTIAWLSKKQETINTSVFGADFFVIKIGMETLRGLQYKLRMMGVKISGLLLIYGEYMSVIHNTQQPYYILEKNPNQCFTMQLGNMWK